MLYANCLSLISFELRKRKKKAYFGMGIPFVIKSLQVSAEIVQTSYFGGEI